MATTAVRNGIDSYKWHPPFMNGKLVSDGLSLESQEKSVSKGAVFKMSYAERSETESGEADCVVSHCLSYCLVLPIWR